MRWRTYTIKMPAFPLSPGIILVERPGTLFFGGTFSQEWRGRTLRVPQKALLPSGSPNPSFAPRFRLGFHLSVVCVGPNEPCEDGVCLTAIPCAFLSASLVGPVVLDVAGTKTVGGDPWLAGTAGLPDSGPNPAIPEPGILLKNSQCSANGLYRVHLGVCEAKDEDRDDTGSV